MNDINSYKRKEIESHLMDYLDCCDADQIEKYVDDSSELHQDAFNQDYYIIGTWKSEQWLGSMSFQVIGFIKDYEQDNFGEVCTDLSNPERIVNMFTYIIGEEIVSCGDWKEKLEESNREKVIKGDKQAVGVAVALALGEEYA